MYVYLFECVHWYARRKWRSLSFPNILILHRYLSFLKIIFSLSAVIELPPSVTSSESPGENVNLLCVIMLTFVVLTMYCQWRSSTHTDINALTCEYYKFTSQYCMLIYIYSCVYIYLLSMSFHNTLNIFW